MGEIKIKLPEEVERAFRQLAMRKFGYQKGSISEAAGEAIGSWTNNYDNELNNHEFSWDSLVGIMKKVKKNSVQLQHEAWNFVNKKSVKKKNADRH